MIRDDGIADRGIDEEERPEVAGFQYVVTMISRALRRGPFGLRFE